MAGTFSSFRSQLKRQLLRQPLADLQANVLHNSSFYFLYSKITDLIINYRPQVGRQLHGSRDLVCLSPVPSRVPGREQAGSKYLLNKCTWYTSSNISTTKSLKLL